MITPVYCSSDGHYVHLEDLSTIDQVIAGDQNLLWLDLFQPDDKELQLIAEEFNFLPSAIDDVLHNRRYPKIDEYEGYHVILFYSAVYKSADMSLDTHQLTIFVGQNYLVTVHYDPMPELDAAKKRWGQDVKRIAHEIGVVLFTILDSVSGHYLSIMEDIQKSAEALEDQIFLKNNRDFNDNVEGMLALKRSIVEFRQIVAPERDYMNLLGKNDHTIYTSKKIRYYFQDVYEVLFRVTEMLDQYSDVMTSTLNANLAVVSNDLNRVMRTLTSISIVLMSATLIAGIYGMNFDNMPELKWEFGYPFSLLLMIIVAGGLAYFFKKRNWF